MLGSWVRAPCGSQIKTMMLYLIGTVFFCLLRHINSIASSNAKLCKCQRKALQVPMQSFAWVIAKHCNLLINHTLTFNEFCPCCWKGMANYFSIFFLDIPLYFRGIKYVTQVSHIFDMVSVNELTSQQVATLLVCICQWPEQLITCWLVNCFIRKA